MPGTTIPAKPEVLRWAREFRGFSLAQASAGLLISEEALSGIEEGRRFVSADTFARMKSLYRQTESALLMPASPAPLELPTDFRTVGGVRPQLSPEAHLAIREARRAQWHVSGILDEDPELYPIANIGSASIADDPEVIAARERREFRVPVEAQQRAALQHASFNGWRAAMQESGILVLQKRMPWDDCRGFSLWDHDLVPTIVVNTEDSPNGRIFTLFHEYAHLVLRIPGTCVAGPGTDAESTEPWCNRFAAAFAVPRIHLQEFVRAEYPDHKAREWTLPDVRRLANHYRVSEFMMGIRLKELGITNLYDSAKYRWHWGDRRRQAQSESRAQAAMRREPIERRALRELGFATVGIVLQAIRRDVIDPGDASDMLGVPVDRLRRLDESTRTQRARHVFAA